MSLIRPTVPADTPALWELAQGTGVFKSLEMGALQEVLDDYHEEEHRNGHRATTYDDGEIVGFAYFAPAAMTDRTWYLWWIAVAKSAQARGIGSALLRDAEAAVVLENGRLLLIETSSLPPYEPTRRFYERHGYERAAVVRDYYADGDDLVIFRKRLAPRDDGDG